VIVSLTVASTGTDGVWASDADAERVRRVNDREGLCVSTDSVEDDANVLVLLISLDTVASRSAVGVKGADLEFVADNDTLRVKLGVTRSGVDSDALKRCERVRVGRRGVGTGVPGPNGV
jgi:hypothetical protein